MYNTGARVQEVVDTRLAWRYVEIDLTIKAKALETCELARSETTVGRWRSNSDLLGWLESL